jgi:hypothetical protein
MTPEQRIERYMRLRDEVIDDVVAGRWSQETDDKLSAIELEFAWLPDQRKNDLELRHRSLMETAEKVRRKFQARAAGAGKIRYFPIVHRDPTEGHDCFCR